MNLIVSLNYIRYLAVRLRRSLQVRLLFFTADLRLPKLVRLKLSRKTPLFNGALECRLFKFEMVSGSNRKA